MSVAAQTGDLYVQVNVKEHRIFTRDGKDLYCEVPISFTDAALGGELEVPTLDGRVKLKVPDGTQTGKLFRVRAKGVKASARWSARRLALSGNGRNTCESDLETA